MPYFKLPTSHRPVVLITTQAVPTDDTRLAPLGLRVGGLLHGLTAHGFQVRTVVAQGPPGKFEAPGDSSAARAGHEHSRCRPRQMTTLLGEWDPLACILTNSTQARWLKHPERAEKHPLLSRCAFVLDLLVPRYLARALRPGPPDPRRLRALHRDKSLALGLSDAVLIDSERKFGYALGWLAQTRPAQTRPRLADVSLLPTPPCWPLDLRPPEATQPGLTALVSGYLEPRRDDGISARLLAGHLAHSNCGLVCVGGQVEDGAASLDDPPRSQGNLTHWGNVSFGRLKDLLSRADFVIDLCARTLEREYAMICRCVLALCHGKPVIHPAGTEVGRLIARYGAGWIYEHEREILGIVDWIGRNPRDVVERAAGARALAGDKLDPRVATDPLARFLRSVA